VRRGAANLLGGRAMRYELHGLSASELSRDFELDRILNHAYLPRIYRARSFSKASGSRIAMPSSWALRSLLPAASPATR
jgi:uncharacterized protein